MIPQICDALGKATPINSCRHKYVGNLFVELLIQITINYICNVL